MKMISSRRCSGVISTGSEDIRVAGTRAPSPGTIQEGSPAYICVSIEIVACPQHFDTRIVAV
jgi:hypothetical protein